MYTTRIQADGSLDLGGRAVLAGYGPGVLVDIAVLSTGSLLIEINDEPVLIDISPRKRFYDTANRRALHAQKEDQS